MLQRTLATLTLTLVLGISAALALRPAAPAAPVDNEIGAAIGGPFTLTDQNGKTRMDTDFHGRWMLVYFGFTHCPDICPLGLTNIVEALNQLGTDGDAIQPIFITLDPARDRPKVLKEYLAGFSRGLIGLSGTPEQVDRAAKAYKVYYAREDVPDSALGYTINHSGFLYLMGPDGAYRTHFRHDVTPEALAEGLRAQLNRPER